MRRRYARNGTGGADVEVANIPVEEKTMSVPIADYALLSDRHTAALVSRTGSVDWLCAPRFDSPSLFGRLLDRGAGHFSLRPLDAAADVERRYVDETMVLETTWTTATGTLVVPTRWPPATVAATRTRSGRTPPARSSARWSAPQARSRWPSSLPPAPSTAWSSRCSPPCLAA